MQYPSGVGKPEDKELQELGKTTEEASGLWKTCSHVFGLKVTFTHALKKVNRKKEKATSAC